MSKLLVHVTMSLDGYIAGPDDEMGWIFHHAGDMSKELENEVIARTGATLGGRRAYEIGRQAERPEMRKLFGGRWDGPQFILTNEPTPDEPDPSFRFVSGDVRDATAAALTAAEGRDVLILGASIVNQCLEAGLIDEILIQLVPELLGAGIRLFGGIARTSLQTVDASRSGQVVNLRFHLHQR